MRTKNFSNTELDSHLKKLVKEERRITLDILHQLREVESRRSFIDLNCSSLFEYCTRELKYSDGSAHRRISSMRLLKEIPEIETKIAEGNLSICVIAQAKSFFRIEKSAPEEKRAILLALEGKSTRAAQTELASRTETPEKLIPEKQRPISQTHSRLEIVLENRLLEKLQSLKNLLANSKGDLSTSETLELAIDVAISRLTPSAPKNPLPAAEVSNSRYIPREVRRQVWARDLGRCQICHSNYRLNYDHIVPFARGGETSLKNLRLLCFQHNQHANHRS